jgi:hypothetical protein
VQLSADALLVTTVVSVEVTYVGGGESEYGGTHSK